MPSMEYVMVVNVRLLVSVLLSNVFTQSLDACD